MCIGVPSSCRLNHLKGHLLRALVQSFAKGFRFKKQAYTMKKNKTNANIREAAKKVIFLVPPPLPTP